MQPVGSVAAFVARHVERPEGDPIAAEILDTLDREARLVVEAQAVPAAERCAWLREHTGGEWSEARLAHVEQRAFVQIRRELQQRAWWRG